MTDARYFEPYASADYKHQREVDSELDFEFWLSDNASTADAVECGEIAEQCAYIMDTEDDPILQRVYDLANVEGDFNAVVEFLNDLNDAAHGMGTWGFINIYGDKLPADRRQKAQELAQDHMYRVYCEEAA